MQTSIKRISRLAEPRSLTARQHSATADPRAEHTTPSHAFFAHYARFRFARGRRSVHGRSELSHGNAQIHGQNQPWTATTTTKLVVECYGWNCEFRGG